MTTRHPLQRRPATLALEPRILLDAAVVETAKEVAEQSSESGDSGSWIDRPSLTATPADMNLTMKDSNDEFPTIDLFKNVTVSPNSIWGEDETIDAVSGETSGRPLRDLTITVSATGSSHALVVDGSTITLESTELPGETEGNGYTYTVSVSGGTTTIVIAINSSSLPTARTSEGAAALIDSIAYQAQDLNVTTSDVSVSLTLSESKADGSAGNSTEGRITSTVHIIRDSDAPVAPDISTGPTLEPAESFDSDDGLPGADQVTYSADGKYAYTAGAGTFATFSVDASGRLTLVDSVAVEDLGTVESLVASSDGKSVYSMSTNGKLVEMSVDADGTLSHVGTYTVSSNSSGSLAISADGTQVYADGGDSQRAVKVYTRDTSTGRLLVSQQFSSITLTDTEYDALNEGAGNYNGATISISRSSGANAKDSYDFSTLYYYDEEDGGGTLSYGDGQIFYDDYSSNKAIATFVNTNGTLTITFTEDVSTKMVNRVLNQISFSTNSPDNITMTLTVDQSASQNVLLLDNAYALKLTQNIDSAIRQTTIIQAGNYLYVVNNGGSLWGNRTLEVYQRNSNGTWAVLDNITQLNAGTDWGSTSDPIAVSSDGLYVYISAHESGTLDVYRLNTTSGFLSPVNSIELPGDAENADSISLSADGNTLYVVTDDGAVSIYSVSGSRLTLQGSVSSITSGDMTLSSDGLSLIIANGEGITRYSLAQAIGLGESITFADDLNLSDNNSDKLADGAGNYNGSSITVSPSITSGSFGFAQSNGLSLAEGHILSGNTTIASFSTDANGKLTITFTANVSTEVANQVLQQITYTNSDASTAGTLITLSIQASDGELTSPEQIITLRVNTSPVLNTDVSTGYTLRDATSETAYKFTLFAGLFSDADGDALIWSVSGLPEGLTFDSRTRTISGTTSQTGSFDLVISATDASGNAADTLNLTLEVLQIANRAPQVNAEAGTSLTPFTEGETGSVSVNSNLFTDADSVYGDDLTWTVSGLPDGLTFDAITRTISGTTSVVADYTLTVTVTDKAGLSAQTELTLRVISDSEAGNKAPEFNSDSGSLVYASGTLSGYGDTGTYVNGLVLSSDETILVVASSTNNNGNGTHYLNIYSRDTSTGALTLLQVFSQGAEDNPDTSTIEIDGLQNVTSVTYSADGKQLYLTGYNSTDGASATNHSLMVFNVNDDGSLSYLGHSDNISEKVVHVSVDENSGTLYALSSTNIYAFSVGSDGVFTLLESYTPDNGFGTAVTMRFVDGTAYVLSGARLTVYNVTDSGTLSYVGQMTRSGSTLIYTNADGTSNEVGTIPSNAFSGNNSLSVSDQGYIYLTTSNGYLTTLQYNSASGELSYVGATDAYTPLGYYPYDVTLSADGTTLYMSGANSSKIIIYSIGDDGQPIDPTTLGTSGGISRLVITQDGTSIYGGKNLFFGTTTLNTIQALGVGTNFSEGGSAIHPAEKLNLSDAEYDAKNSYDGATITITRDGEANTADTFGFSDANGLTLDGSTLSLNGSAIATVTNADGKLTITFTANVDKATANQVLHQITYNNTSDDPGSNITLKVSVSDEYTSSSTNIIISVAEINNAPALSATAEDVVYTSGGNAVKLFDDSVISTGESTQSFNSATITISGLFDGGNEKLVIGGTSITLESYSSASGTIKAVAGENGEVTEYSYYLSVSIAEDGTATVTLSGEMPVEVAQTLINSITYANTSEAPTTGDRTITLASIQDNGGTDNGGIDTTSLAIAATVSVSLTNTAPSVSGSGASTTHTENGEATTLFSGVTIDTKEAGQSISSFTITVSGTQDGDAESLVIDGTTIALVKGFGSTVNGYDYAVTVDDASGLITIVISSTSGIATQDAVSLIESVTYANDSDNPDTGERIVTLTSIQDDGGTSNDGQDTASLSIAAKVSVTAVNDAPVIKAKATETDYTVTASASKLFSDVTLSTVESGQGILSVTFTVSGLRDGSSESLNIDATTVALQAGSGTTSNGYSYTVTLDGDTATIVIKPGADQSSLSADAAKTLIADASYTNASSTKTVGERAISVSVQDNGGTANGGQNSATLSASAKISVLENATPVISAGADYNELKVGSSLASVEGLGTITSITMPQAGNYLYATDGDGTIAVFSRDASSGHLTLLQTLESGILNTTQITLGEDGSTVYVLGENGNSIGIFSSSDAGLASTQTLETENATQISVANDGNSIYIIDGNYSGLKVYTRDAESGHYSLTQSIAASTTTEPYLFNAVGIETRGDYVFIITDPASDAVANTLIVYQRGADGTLTAIAHARDEGSMASPVAMAISDDGSTIYIASTNSIAIFGFDSANGTLTASGTLSGLSDVSSAALSARGDTLYLGHTDGSIGRYQISGNTLTLVQTLAGDASAISGIEHLISADDGSLAALGNSGLASLSDTLIDIPLQYTEQGTPFSLADMLTLNDADHDAQADGAGNYNGFKLTLAREQTSDTSDSFSFAEGNGLTFADGTILLDGKAIATFAQENGTLTLVFTADVSKATANQVLHQIQYSNASDDPGAVIRLTLTASDIYGASTQATLALAVTEVNDAPTLEAQPADTRYVENAEAVGLFTNATVSTVENGQSITELTLTVAGLKDGANETLLADGSSIALISGSGTTSSGYAYTVTLSGDTATIVITSGTSNGNGIAAESVASLVNSLTYANSGDTPSEGTRSVTITSIRDNGGTANGSADSGAPGITAKVAVAAVNDAPVVASSGATATFIENGDSVALFNGTTIDTIEAGQNIASITLTIAGVSDGSNETLTFDGTAITLTPGTGNTSSGYGYAYTITSTSSGLSLSINFGANGVSSTTAASAIDAMRYADAGDAPTAGIRTITLSALRDNGGTANGGADTATLSISATVAVQPVNDAPQASDTDVTLDDTPQGENYSFTLPADMFFDVDGDTLTWTVEGLPQGLAFDDTSRTISGRTLASPGDYSFTVTVTDPSGATASRTLTLTVDEPNAYISPSDLTAHHLDDLDSGTLADTANSQFTETALRGNNTTTLADALAAQAPAHDLDFASSAGLLDALLPPLWDDAAPELTAVKFVDGRSSPLVMLGASDGPALTASRNSINGTWVYDPAGNRMVCKLPDGLFASRTLVAALDLRMADGKALPPGVRLDIANGSIVAAGMHARPLDLQLIVRTADGQSLALPVHVTATRSAISAAPATDDATALAFKPAVSEQLRQGPASDLLAQARTLLEQLSENAHHETLASAANADTNAHVNTRVVATAPTVR